MAPLVLAAKPTTLPAVREAGVRLETYDERWPLRLVVVLLPPPEHAGEAGIGWAVQAVRPDGTFDIVMADLTTEEDWANQDRVRALMALTAEEEAERDRTARLAAAGLARGPAGEDWIGMRATRGIQNVARAPARVPPRR